MKVANIEQSERRRTDTPDHRPGS